MKSAYELAMERLRQNDKEAGVEARQPLTAGQKARIAELRTEAEAKRAELHILRRDRVAAAGPDPQKRAEEDEHFQIDLRRVDSWLEEKLAEVRRG